MVRTTHSRPAINEAPLPIDSPVSRCGACRRTFRNVDGFDSHRKGGECVDPTTVGLTEVDGLWATPAGHAERGRLTARAANARAAACTKRRSHETARADHHAAPAHSAGGDALW